MEKNNSFKVKSPEEISAAIEAVRSNMNDIYHKLNFLMETFKVLYEQDSQPEIADFGAWAHGISLILNDVAANILDCDESMFKYPENILMYSVDQAKVEERIEYLKSIGIADPTSP